MATQADREQLTGVKEDYKYHFVDDVKPFFKPERGLSHGLIDQISDHKREPDWMRRIPARGAGSLLVQARPDLGAGLERHRL